MRKYYLLFFFITALISCTEEPESSFVLKVTVMPEGAGQVAPSEGEFSSGEVVELVPSANDYYKFEKWTGDWGGVENPLSITMNIDKTIVANFTKMDSDSDGVTDDIDNCTDTPSGETVDENGCSSDQRDDDDDGINNGNDLCDNTPSGETVDENGCSDSQKDLDGDGFIGSEDCDDTNDAINPNATEVCDGVDNNCDGNIDDSNENLSPCEECSNGVIVQTNGNACDDGDACTVNDVCNNGNCLGNPIVCSDGNPCTIDSCDPDNGCTFINANDGYICDDGDACTIGDNCISGSCLGYAISCDDGDSCTLDSCDSSSGCKNTPQSGTDYCDDDGDGYSEAQGDCNDSDINIYPGAIEVCGDFIDNDCDGLIDEKCIAN